MALRARLIPIPLPPEREWPHHKAEWKSMPAHILWRGDRRMEGETYLAEGYQVRLGIEERAAGWNRLGQICRVWQPNRLKGIQVGEDDGTPFLAATQVFSIRPTPRKWLAMAKTPGSSQRFLDEGTILVTCSGTVGRAITAPESLTGTLITHDLLRVVPNSPELAGWVYAFLQSPQARLMMTSSHYGQIIKHLETAHLDALPVPIVTPNIATDFNRRSKKIHTLRNKAHCKTLEAEKIFEEALGSIDSEDWGEDGFIAKSDHLFAGRRRFEGTFHNPAASKLVGHLRKSGLKLQTIASAGFKAWLPSRFTRIPAVDGIEFLDSADLFEWNPPIVKRIAEVKFGDEANGRVSRGWLLLARSGQSYGINGTPVIANAALENKIISDHVIRIAPGPTTDMRVGYLHTALAHPTLGRPLVKSLVYGSSIPEIDVSDLLRLEVVRIDREIENKIADLAEAAAEARGEADELERQMAADAGQLLARFMAGDVTDFVVTMPPAIADSPATARPFGEHDCVRLAVARKDAGLRNGALGAIVHVYPDGLTYEVEFPDAKPGHEVLTLEAKLLLPENTA